MKAIRSKSYLHSNIPCLVPVSSIQWQDGHVQKLSYDEAFSKRKYKHQNFIFDINHAKGTTSVYYLRVKSSEQMVLPIIIGSEKTIMEKLVTNDLAWGIFIGLILVMVVYNFFIWLSVRGLQLFLLCILQFICRAHTGYTQRIHLSIHLI
jgi:two-component system NtrC family sensor kinase